MFQAVDCDLFLYADDSFLVTSKGMSKKSSKHSTKYFQTSVTGLSITNSAFILRRKDQKYSVWHRLLKENSLDIRYGKIHIKQYHTVTYLGCALDKVLSGESMALNVIKKSILDDFVIEKIYFYSSLSVDFCVTH